MTGNKRFTQKDEDDWEILDRNKHFAYAHSGFQAEKIIQELNELVETNRELYKENKKLKQSYNKLKQHHHNLHDELNEVECKNKELEYENELLSDELEQCKAVINKKWSEYLKKKELSE